MDQDKQNDGGSWNQRGDGGAWGSGTWGGNNQQGGTRSWKTRSWHAPAGDVAAGDDHADGSQPGGDAWNVPVVVLPSSARAPKVVSLYAPRHD